MIAAQVAEALPKVEIRRVEVVGARVSGELFRNGLLATALALVAVLFISGFASSGSSVWASSSP